MHDNSADLIRMINQMADFYRPYAREEAEAGVAQHVKDFWDPRMRKGLSGVLASGGAGLSDLALAGARRALAPKNAEPAAPTSSAKAGGSDG